MGMFVVEARYFNGDSCIFRPFADRYEAQQFVEDQIFNLQEKFDPCPYLHLCDGWWEADFNAEYKEPPLPIRFKVSEVMDPSGFSFDGSAGEEIRDVEGM